jgi:hypothetical protein
MFRVAKWNIYESDGGTRVTYKQRGGRSAARVYDCGHFNSRDTPRSMVVDWVATHAVAGDAISVNGRLELVVMPEGRA